MEDNKESEELNEVKDKQHIKTEEKTLSCFQIESEFPLTQTSSKKFTCSQCGKSFSHKVSLTRHMTIHTGEKKHACDQCGKKFPYKGSLVHHIRIHTGEKNYLCDQCGKRFLSKKGFKVT